jgi:hypothetical protein
MVNKAKSLAVQGIFCQDNDNTHFLFNHIFSLHGGRGYDDQINRSPKTVSTLSKNTVKGDITFKTLNINLG